MDYSKKSYSCCTTVTAICRTVIESIRYAGNYEVIASLSGRSPTYTDRLYRHEGCVAQGTNGIVGSLSDPRLADGQKP